MLITQLNIGVSKVLIKVHFFTDDLLYVPWDDIRLYDDVNDALQVWQSMFKNVVNKHIPTKHRRVPSHWLNNTIFKHMSKSDYLHRKAIRTNSMFDWNDF